MQFRSTIELGGKTATGFEVPGRVVDELGAGKRPAVQVTVNGHRYRSTVAVMGGRSCSRSARRTAPRPGWPPVTR